VLALLFDSPEYSTREVVASFLPVRRECGPGNELVFVGSRERAVSEQGETAERAHFDKRPNEKGRCL
jgi:hypothetical protein